MYAVYYRMKYDDFPIRVASGKILDSVSIPGGLIVFASDESKALNRPEFVLAPGGWTQAVWETEKESTP